MGSYSNNEPKGKNAKLIRDGKVEEINSLLRTEGTNPTEQVVTSNRDGSNLESKTVSSMYRIKGRPNEAFSVKIGNMGCIEVDYVRRSHDDDYLSIPVESTTTRYVNSELKRNMDKTKNTRVDEELERYHNQKEQTNEKINYKNIDDDLNNNTENTDLFIDNEENTINKQEFLNKISNMYDEQEIQKRLDEGETLDEIEDDANREFRNPRSDRE